ncbi:GTP cyclohydrolase IIa [Halosegnis marinus]|uniref:GTP cyclohydrolase III n=1 Tax=Halosegnis marinus TaxID=3034023 RepID=A0ABD5ZJV8_9EURY|nr:GTP cyclohydrolase IIa [Halosegnis sp. DT85]
MVAVQVDDYGPWTTTPRPRRETDLQALQARLFADVADFVGGRDGYAFAGRFDNMVGTATRIETDTFERLQERVRNRYPVTVSIGVGTGETPAAALDAAGSVISDAGSAQGDRRETLGDRVAEGFDGAPDTVTVAHFDVVDATGTYTDAVSPTRAELDIRGGVLSLAEYLHDEHGAVTQFVGGDNAIAVTPALDRAAVAAATDHVRAEVGVDLQVGVGRGPTAHAAGDEAKHALETCRETGRRAHGPWAAADD